MGDAQYFGVGEAIHTSGGFHKARHRVARFLVETMGFRAVGLENPWSWTDGLTQYVQTCQGNVDAAMLTSL